MSSSVESYVVHRWTLDLSSEDMDLLREMMELAMEHSPTPEQCVRYERLCDVVECVE